MRLMILVLLVSTALVGSAGAQSTQPVNAELIRLHDDLHLSATQEVAWRGAARFAAGEGRGGAGAGV